MPIIHNDVAIHNRISKLSMNVFHRGTDRAGRLNLAEFHEWTDGVGVTDCRKIRLSMDMFHKGTDEVGANDGRMSSKSTNILSLNLVPPGTPPNPPPPPDPKPDQTRPPLLC